MQSNNDISVYTKGRGGITDVQYLDFNELSEIEFPQVFLCHKATVNKKGIKTVKKYGELFPIHNLKITQNLNSVDTVNFSIPRYINKTENQLWHLITDLKIIQIPKFGNFQITVTRTNTGENEIKDIVGQSLEVELGQILLHDFEANTIGQIESDANYQTIYFYRPFDPQHSLLHQILLKTPGWSIGHVDETLWNKVRSFDVDNVSIYDFLTNTIAEELECIFEFDSFHRSISCYLLESYGTHTAIYVSNDNLVNEITVESKSDQIKNCFKVKGGEGIYISEVNPNGTDYLWMLTEQDKSDMSSELKTRLETYDALYQSNITSYENIMKRIHEIFLELSDLTHKVSSSTDPYSSLSECGLMQLKELQSSYQSIEDTYITAGYGNPNNSFYTTLYVPNHTKLTRVASEIKQRENEIETKNTDYKNAQNIRNQIQKTLNLQDYLTLNEDPSLWQELSLYRREDIYENPNYSSTENSTLEEIFELERGLYEDAVKALTEASTPVYHFTANLNNILANPSYARYGTEDFKLGNFIRVELDDESVAKVRLISISIDFDHLENIELEFSDVIGNDGNLVDIKSILNQASSLTTSYDTIKRQYESSKNSIDFVSQMKRDGLNAALVSITNSDSQDLLFDEHGLLCRQYNPQKMDFEPEQLKLIHNLIAYTDDNWRSVRQAMGKINFNGVDLYGVIADALVGNIIAGNNLIISNKNNSFIVDEFGATLKNASLSIEKGNTKILLDPENGIKIRSGHTDVFYVDENGHIHIEGIGAGLDLTANSTVKDIYSKITQTAEQIALEVKRATDAEGVLNSKITLTADSIAAEVHRATTAEGELSGKLTITADKITSEVKRATASELELSSKIEQTAGSLTSTISQSVQDLTTKISQTSTAITAEAKRAVDAETELSGKLTIAADNITAEIKRAKDSEGVLSSRIQQTADSITAEVHRATTAEGTLNSKITQTADIIIAEVTRAKNAEGELSSRITQTAESITQTMTANLANYSTTIQMRSEIQQTASNIRQTITQEINGVTNSISSVEQTANKISWLIKSGTSSTNFTLTDKAISLVTSKINLTGFVTFSSLTSAGKTTINGSNITTGTIDASRVIVKNLNADKISSGTIDANKIRVINLTANEIKSGTLDATKVTVKDLNASSITTGTIDADTIEITNIKGDSIKTGTIDASKITVKNIDANNILTGTIDASKITVKNLNADYIASGAINAGKIRVFDINADYIITGTLDATKVTVKNLDAKAITTGTLDASRITVKNLNADAITSGKLSINFLWSGNRRFINTSVSHIVTIGGTGNDCINQIQIGATDFLIQSPNCMIGWGGSKLAFFGGAGGVKKAVKKCPIAPTADNVRTSLNSLIEALASYGLIGYY